MNGIQFVKGGFHLGDNAQSCEAVAGFLRARLQAGDLPSERALTGIREFLVEAGVDFTEAGVRIAQRRERKDVPFVHLAEHHFRVGERARRRHARARGINRAPCGPDLGITIQGLADQVLEAHPFALLRRAVCR